MYEKIQIVTRSPEQSVIYCIIHVMCCLFYAKLMELANCEAQRSSVKLCSHNEVFQWLLNNNSNNS